VKVTAGTDDPERCNQGFTVAATAVTAGADVSLWLTGEAAWLGPSMTQLRLLFFFHAGVVVASAFI